MSFLKSKALFLDRDGIIIEDAGYTKDANLVRLIPEIVSLISGAQQRNYQVIIVTNQSGIGRGAISLHNYQKVTHRMLKLLEDQGALYITLICFAPYYEHAKLVPMPTRKPHQIDNPWNIPHIGIWSESWRKPNLGMIEYARSILNIDLTQSLIVGDRWTDQLLAVNSELKFGAWYCPQTSSLNENSEFLKLQGENAKKISIIDNLTSAIDLLDL